MTDCFSCKWYSDASNGCFAQKDVRARCPVLQKSPGRVALAALVEAEVEEYKNKKDPNGLMRHDMLHLRKTFKRKRYSPKNTLAELMYEEGIQRVLDYIEERMVDRGNY